MWTLALVVLAFPGAAFGQATRTWVSGVGDDANPCSRTAPCKTFAGAISKTAAAGEINCLDPGGFGGVTITKSMTIKCQYTEGGVLVSGTNAIVINAAATDKVTLRGLDIDGLGNSLSGVKVISGAVTRILDSEIYGFASGVTVSPTTATKVFITDSDIHGNGVGVINAPGNNTINFASTIIRNSNLVDNTCGAVASSFGTNASTPNAATDCGSAGSGSGINRTSTISAFHSILSFNSTGALARGSLSVAELGWDEVTANNAFGIHRVDSGVLRTYTPQTNVISNNSASDSFNSTVPMQ